MKVIHKFEVPVHGELTMLMPFNMRIKAFQMQHGKPHVWCEVNPEEPLYAYNFRIIATGQPYDDLHLDYVGTVQDGEFVWHLFSDWERGRND